jgi:hypothetical protein
MIFFAPPYKELATIQNGIHFSDIRSIVDYDPVHFDPGVGLEWKYLCSHDHFRGDATEAKERSCGRRALEAQHFFPIPDARFVNGRADSFYFIRRSCHFSTKRARAHFVVESGKIMASKVKLEQ